MQVLKALLASVVAQQAPTFWQRLADVASTNPVLTVLALLTTAFGAGFAVRKLFEDRGVSLLRTQLAETQTALAQAKRDQVEREERKAQESAVVNAIGGVFPLPR